MRSIFFLFSIFLSSLTFGHNGMSDENLYWMRISALNSADRTRIANSGAAVESATADYITVLAKESEKEFLLKTENVEISFLMTTEMFDFPAADQNFLNNKELNDLMVDLQNKNPNLVHMASIGKTVLGQDIWALTITNNQNLSNELDIPAVLFVGTHHAREHLSTEMPIKLAQHLVNAYNANDTSIVSLLNSRVVYVVPLLNPDGSEFDISTGNYKMWRKNRRNNGDGTFGVDLNRNYGFKWGGTGASSSSNSDTYRGPSAFSEPETQSMKNFIESHTNITSLLSFHSFSKLVLYPWGYTHDPIAKTDDQNVFKSMGQTMAAWNGYKPQTGADLYLVSGEMGDWAYGEHGIFAFTFELDPASIWEGGFYPGQSVIDPVFKKNLKPCLYLIEYADNPYRVLQSKSQQLGLRSALF